MEVCLQKLTLGAIQLDKLNMETTLLEAVELIHALVDSNCVSHGQILSESWIYKFWPV
jgi:hypothetical protein